MDLTVVLFIISMPFVLLTAYFGTKNDFYESENYKGDGCAHDVNCLLYTSPSPRDKRQSRMPSSA